MAAYQSVDWSAVASAATDALAPLLGQAVQSIRLETAYFPPVDIVGADLTSLIGSGPSGEATINAGAILKPKLTIQLAVGNPIVIAPYGDPGEGSWLPLFAVLGAIFGIGYYAGKRAR